MNEDLHDIDDLFKKALDDHAELPSAAVWDNIDQSLDKKKVVSISKKYNTLKWAVALLLLFSFGMAMYIMRTGIKEGETVKSNNARQRLQNQKRQGAKALKEGGKETETAGIKIDTKIGTPTLDKIIDTLIPSPVNTNTLPQNQKEGAAANEDKTALHNQVSTLPAERTNRSQPKVFERPVSRNNVPRSLIGKQGSNMASAAGNKQNTAGTDQAGKQQGIPEQIFETEPYFAAVPLIDDSQTLFQPGLLKPFRAIIAVSGDEGRLQPGLKNLPINKSGKNKVTLSATVFFSPDVVSTNLKKDAPHFREDDRHEIEKNENFRFNSSLGILLDYNNGNNWILESGLTFSTRVSNIRPKIIYARPDNNGNLNYRFNCAAGYSYISVKSAATPVYGDSIRALSAKNTLQYIGVPLGLRYAFNLGKFRLIPGIGISANFLTNGKIETKVSTINGDQPAANDIQGLKSMYFNGSLALGAEYRLNKTLGLTFIPTARFGLSAINQDAPVKTNLNSIGLVAGAVIRF